MKTYIVGGYVRDTLLGLTPRDQDYVVVDATPNDLEYLGYTQVGKDFPVFLDPETGSEYALARTERKTGSGYSGFSCKTKHVTLEQDLYRRDLTINAMAMDSLGSIIDPYGGQADIKSKTLRHVSEHFAEDPLRVLRLARLRARFGPDWKIHPSTKLLIDTMESELLSLQPDRVYTEVSKVMNTHNSYLFFITLDELNVLDIVFPNISKLKLYREGSVWHQEPNVFEHTMSMLKFADSEPDFVKFMILYHDIAKPYCRFKYGNGAGHDSAELAEPLIDIKLPSRIKQYVLHHVKTHQRMFKVYDMSASKVLKLIKSFRNNDELLHACLTVARYDKLGATRLGTHSTPELNFDKFCLAYLRVKHHSFKNTPLPASIEHRKQIIHNTYLNIVKTTLKN